MVQKLSYTANSITLGTGNSRVILGADSGNLIVKDRHANTSTLTPGSGVLGMSGVTTYANSSVLPFSPISSAGSLAYATLTSTLYLSNGSGWYKISTINTSPSISLSSTTATPTPSSLTLDFTYTVTEPEGTPTTVSIANSGIATTGNVAVTHTASNSHVRLVFDGTTAYSGDASVTLTVTDGVNTGSGTITITTNYITLVDESETTGLLMRGIGDSTTKNANFDDVSDTNNTITTNGLPFMGTFSPYNSGGYSGYFDGSSDYLTASNSDDFTLTGQFTIEMWVYLDQTSYARTVQRLITPSNSSPTSEPYISIGNDQGGVNSGCLCFTSSVGAGNPQGYATTEGTGATGTNRYFPFKQWVHVALTRDGSNVCRLFQDGVIVATVTISGGFDFNGANNGGITISKSGWNNSEFFGPGYINDFRIVKGTAVYTAAFTPPNEPLTAITNTKLLLGAKAMMRDTSASARAITVTGTPEMRAFTPYRHKTYVASDFGGSVYLDGASYLTTSGTANTNTTGGQAWTVEYWVYPTVFDGGGNAMFDFRANGSGNGITAEFTSSGNMYMNAGGSGYISNQDYDISVNNWYHMAFVHTGSVLKFYLNGVEKYSNSHTSGANDNSSGVFGIGYKSNGSKQFKGYITDFRFVAGKAVYTGAFTPPSKRLTKTGGTYPSNTNVVNPTASETKYLANFTNGDIIDLSGSGNILPYGNAQSDTGVTKYSVSSVLFDGTGDYLSIPYSDLYAPGAENYTAECWIYTATDNQTQPLLMGMWNGSSNYSWALQLGAGTSMYPRFLFWDGSSYNDNPATTKINISSWNHIAVVRNSSTFTLFLNGVSVKTATISGAAPTVNTPLTIGATSSGGQAFTGNISDARFTKTLRYPFIPKKETMTTSTSFQATTTASNVKMLGAHTSTLTTNSGNSGTSFSVESGVSASAFAPIGNGMRSAYFDGSGNAMMIHAAAIIGTGVFTIECWAYITKTSGYDPIFGIVPVASRNSSSGYRLFYVGGNNNLSWWNTTDFVTSPNNSVPNNEWHHLAVTRESDNKIRLYIDGGNVGTSSSTYTEDLSSYDRIYLGRHASAYYQGYISNARITNQVLYTENFTVPGAALKG